MATRSMSAPASPRMSTCASAQAGEEVWVVIAKPVTRWASAAPSRMFSFDGIRGTGIGRHADDAGLHARAPQPVPERVRRSAGRFPPGPTGG